MGRHDTPLKISTGKLDLFSDTMADYNGTIGFHDLRADNAVAYISPSWSGFQFCGCHRPSGGATGAGPGPEPQRSDASIAGAYSLAGIYSNGPFYASVAYESLGNELLQSTPTSLNPCDWLLPTVTAATAVASTRSSHATATTTASGVSASACSTGTASP